MDAMIKYLKTLDGALFVSIIIYISIVHCSVVWSASTNKLTQKNLFC